MIEEYRTRQKPNESENGLINTINGGINRQHQRHFTGQTEYLLKLDTVCDRKEIEYA